jgi:hypothetical protein
LSCSPNGVWLIERDLVGVLAQKVEVLCKRRRGNQEDTKQRRKSFMADLRFWRLQGYTSFRRKLFSVDV